MTPTASANVLARVARRTKAFTDRFPGFGPIVFVSSSLYFVVQLLVAWVWHPAYSVVTNTISDLGNTRCGLYRGASVCSPRHDLMNAGFIFLGLVMAVGSLLICQEFTERGGRQRLAARVGFSLLALAGAGSIVVGLFPENTVRDAHVVGAGLAIGVGNLAIGVLWLALPLPAAIRSLMAFIGTVSIVALVLFASHRYLGIGAGGMERVAAITQTVWLIRFGACQFRTHRERAGATAR